MSLSALRPPRPATWFALGTAIFITSAGQAEQPLPPDINLFGDGVAPESLPESVVAELIFDLAPKPAVTRP